tara:strand:- start:106 stop:804 length:699 start_codon:yes stop_codon:yes gene_type:complete
MKNRKLWILTALAATFFTVACEKDSLNTNVEPDPVYNPDWGLGDDIPIVTDIYFKAKIDSTVYVYQDSIQNQYNTTDTLKGEVCGDSSTQFIQLTRFTDTWFGFNEIEFRFINCLADTFGGDGDTLAGYDTLAQMEPLRTGTYAFGSTNSNNLQNGIQVIWRDADGVEYSSRPGTGANQNFSFNISKIDSNLNDDMSIYLITGTLDLTVYNGVNGIPIESGEFRMRAGLVQR